MPTIIQSISANRIKSCLKNTPTNLKIIVERIHSITNNASALHEISYNSIKLPNILRKTSTNSKANTFVVINGFIELPLEEQIVEFDRLLKMLKVNQILIIYMFMVDVVARNANDLFEIVDFDHHILLINHGREIIARHSYDVHRTILCNSCELLLPILRGTWSSTQNASQNGGDILTIRKIGNVNQK